MAAPPERCTISCPIARVMAAAEDAWQQSLRAITLADLTLDVVGITPPETLERAIAWLRA